MIHVVTIVGVLMCIIALAGLAVPASITWLGSRVAGSASWRGAIVVGRIVFGGIAIIVSNETPYPWTMKIIGVVAIMAGTLIAVVDADTLKRWTTAMSRGGAGIRGLSLLALVMGVFLIHVSL